MNGQNKGAKRACTEKQDGAGILPGLPGLEQLLLSSPELQARLGRKFCDKTELLPLLLAHGLVRRVRTIQIEVKPLGGDSFKVTLDASKRTVGEVKAEVARVQGTIEACQELYKVAAVCEDADDGDAELLENESMLDDGEIVTMTVNELRLLWRTFPATDVVLSDGGAVATRSLGAEWALTTTGIELTEGRHYWEVEMLSKEVLGMYVGISRPNLDPRAAYFEAHCTDAWFIGANSGALFGNGKQGDDRAGGYNQGDRTGFLLDLDNGSLRLFKNGVQNGPGYAAGSVTGPVVAAVQMYNIKSSVRLLPDAEPPAGV
jgi:hypothetical protein